jgi:formylmethanofuran dehydrogenase subunit B
VDAQHGRDAPRRAGAEDEHVDALVRRAEDRALAVAHDLHLDVPVGRDVGQQLAEVDLVVPDKPHEAADRDVRSPLLDQ